jgi:hypothetical protein
MLRKLISIKAILAALNILLLLLIYYHIALKESEDIFNKCKLMKFYIFRNYMFEGYFI